MWFHGTPSRIAILPLVRVSCAFRDGPQGSLREPESVGGARAEPIREPPGRHRNHPRPPPAPLARAPRGCRAQRRRDYYCDQVTIAHDHGARLPANASLISLACHHVHPLQAFGFDDTLEIWTVTARVDADTAAEELFVLLPSG
ncbi:hypothetical protein GCM10010469_35240 [Streptomyces labedae]|uniref:Uncharacterized protein n=2 Tax=Streptomyces TaxID=1883 RepID=A0ABQ2U022_9ACTN|nr:hypothetical protein GCM10010265_58690 [Streptomyces griseoincarnatus]GGT58544.1 hypothetical protein GCM10010287_35870 [Streptomyces variabilis]